MGGERKKGMCEVQSGEQNRLSGLALLSGEYSVKE